MGLGVGGCRGLPFATPFAAIVVALALLTQPSLADDSDFLTLGLGYFDYDDDNGAAEFRLEYQSDWDRWFVRPFSGVMVTTDSSLYGYAGIRLDLFWKTHRYHAELRRGLLQRWKRKGLGIADRVSVAPGNRLQL